MNRLKPIINIGNEIPEKINQRFDLTVFKNSDDRFTAICDHAKAYGDTPQDALANLELELLKLPKST